MSVECLGTLSPGFGPVGEAFTADFTERGEVGAAAPLYACLG